MDLFDVKNQLCDLFGNKQHSLSIVFNDGSKFNGPLYMVVLFEDELVMVENIAELNDSKKLNKSNRIHLSDVKEIYEIIDTGKNKKNPNGDKQLRIYSKDENYIISKEKYDNERR